MPSASAKSGSRVFPLIVLLTIVWGTNWGLFPIAVREVSVWTFRAVCVLGSGILLLGIARMRGIPLFVPRPERVPLAAAGLSYLIVWNIASTYAAILLPSGQAAVLAFTMPVWAMLLSWVFLRERPSSRLLFSISLALAGIGLLALASRGTVNAAPLGFACGLAAAVGWAVGTVILKRARLSIPPLVSAGWQLVIAGVPIAIVAIAIGDPGSFPRSWQTFAVIGYITVVPMALGNLAWFSIANRLPASVSGLSTVMVPMVAMATGALFLQEPLGLLQLAAMACCATAMVLALARRSPPEKTSA